jgi:hypothetical protein
MPSLIITYLKVRLIVLSLSIVIPKPVISYISFYGSIALAELYYAAFTVYRYYISRPIIKNSLVS